MSDESTEQVDSDIIPHQNLVEDVIDERLDGISTENTAIADAVVAHALNSTFSDTEVEAALNALGVKVNAIILALERSGILPTS